MPPRTVKNAKSTGVVTKDVSEKVKEIKLRQKNWMQQREKHLITGKSSSVKEVASEVKGSTFKTESEIARSRSTSEPRADILKVHSEMKSPVSNIVDVRLKHGFNTWLRTRADSQNSNKEKESTFNKGQEKGNLQNVICDGDDNGPPKGESFSQSSPLLAEQFESVADRIVSQVRKDLHILNNVDNKIFSTKHNKADAGHGSFLRGQTYIKQTDADKFHVSQHDDDERNTDGYKDLSSHRCAFCSVLMLMPEQAPTLMVPCGHTLCKSCAQSHAACQLCGNIINSLTTNIMLQQIIQEFHGKTQSAAYVQKKIAKYSEAPFYSASKHKQANYSVQLHNLLARQEALQDEARNISLKEDQAVSRVNRAKRQLEGIKREEEGLLEQQRQIEEKLTGLWGHQQEYLKEFEEMEVHMKSIHDEKVLLEQTLHSLQEEIDKIQFLAEGEKSLIHSNS